MFRFALQERAAAVEACAAAPGARKLAVHIGDKTAVSAGRRQLVSWDKGIVGCREKRRLDRGQREIGLACSGFSGGLGHYGLRLRGLRAPAQYGCGGGAGCTGALQKSTPGNCIFRHVILPRSHAIGAVCTGVSGLRGRAASGFVELLSISKFRWWILG